MSRKITYQQARDLSESVGRHLAYLNRLRYRMERIGFVPSDPLYAATCKAVDAMQHLRMTAYYEGCESGVGR